MTATTLRPYRHIPLDSGACPVCDNVFPLLLSKPVLRKHGPRSNRCPGSHQEPAPWLESSGLPGWENMSDLDRGAALMHEHKRRREGANYAVEHYPVRYHDHPVLTSLDRQEACLHAAVVAHRVDLSDDEYFRLYNLALAAKEVPA